MGWCILISFLRNFRKKEVQILVWVNHLREKISVVKGNSKWI
jgi:hypothetical protein